MIDLHPLIGLSIAQRKYVFNIYLLNKCKNMIWVFTIFTFVLKTYLFHGTEGKGFCPGSVESS